MNVLDLRTKAGAAAGFLKQLANDRRLLIMCELHGRERSVGAIAETLGLSQSALSQHLAKLRQGGLVATRRESQTIHYRIADPAVAAVIKVLHDRFCGRVRASRKGKGAPNVD